MKLCITKNPHTLNQKTFAMCNDRSRDKIPLTITLATYTDIYKRFWEKYIVAQGKVCPLYTVFFKRKIFLHPSRNFLYMLMLSSPYQ